MTRRQRDDMLDEQLHDLAVDIARRAGVVARERRAQGVRIAATKTTPADIVTTADREVEALIRGILARRRPDDGFLGEESGAHPARSGLTWVVDPIDGTVNYAYGLPAYAVSVAVVAGDPDPAAWTPVAAAVYGPAQDELFHAVRGGGAWLRDPSGADRRLTVNPGPFPARALIGTGFGYDPATHAGDLARLARVMPLARDIRRIGSAALDLCDVAAGRLDGYYERGLNPWDHAAGALVVREAGGCVGGQPGDRPGKTMTIAAGALLFADLRDAIDRP